MREFGVLGALGTPKIQVITLVVTESVLMIFLGTRIGSLLGLIWVQWMNATGLDIKALVGSTQIIGEYQISTVIHPRIDWVFFWKASSLKLLFSILAVIPPVYRAVKLKPIQAIRA